MVPLLKKGQKHLHANHRPVSLTSVDIEVLVCHTALPVPCSLMVTCWERADLLALCDVFLCFELFPYGVLGKVCYLVVSILDLWLLPDFENVIHSNIMWNFDENNILTVKQHGFRKRRSCV